MARPAGVSLVRGLLGEHEGEAVVGDEPGLTGERVGEHRALVGTLPLLFLLWAVGVVFGVVVIAEALERTRGLAPSTYGGAFWLAVAFVVVLVLVEVITWFAPRREGERAGGCLGASPT